MMTSFAVSSGRIPAVGYGCWKVPKDRATELIEEVIRAGYRHLDGACDYGNEKEVSKKSLKMNFRINSVSTDRTWHSECHQLWVCHSKRSVCHLKVMEHLP